MLASHLAGLRGGLEAALLLGLLTAWLGRARTGAAPDGRRGPGTRHLWAGAGAAAVAALGAGWLFTYGARELTPEAVKVAGGALSVAAAGCATWAVLRGGGARFAGVTGFLVVAREGLATGLFLWAAVWAAREEAGSAGPLGVVLLGLGVAALAGWAVHAGVRRLPDARLRAWAGCSRGGRWTWAARWRRTGGRGRCWRACSTCRRTRRCSRSRCGCCIWSRRSCSCWPR